MARIMVVKDIWLGNQTSNDWKIFSAVGVLEPVKKSRYEVSNENARHQFKGNFQDHDRDVKRTTMREVN